VARGPKRLAVEGVLRAASDYIPDAIETPLRRALGVDVPRTARAAVKPTMAVTPRKAKPLAVPRPAPKPLALPAPPKQLALPAPGPKLPRFAAKTKGGQWFVDKSIGGQTASDLGVKVAQLPDDGRWVVLNDRTPIIFNSEDEARAKAQSLVDEVNPNRSPENAARRIADNSLRLARDASGPLSELQNWFLRAAPRYIKNEMGTPDDPMRALAERDALHVALSPDEWSDAASGAISRQQIGSALGIDQLYTPAGSDPRAGYDYGASLAVNMPWLKKAPVTDELYGISDTYALQDKMGMGHMLDEMRNAMDPRSGLPSDLAVRPESLGRMGLAQAAERVGLINQFRVKEMERAALDAQNNPVTHVFKDYADDNPMGLKWVEMAPPKTDGPTNYDVEEELRKALKYEGDTMGHCVGNYCPDVMEGRSRIFSLRDAKGEPHVTVETRPHRVSGYYDLPEDDKDIINNTAWDQILKLNQPNHWDAEGNISFEGEDALHQIRDTIAREEYAPITSFPDEIVQIKGKQNRAPKDDYLPFVQDFVKSQNWANIGDMQNTGLVRLPDGRFITGQQAEEIISAIPETTEMVRGFASSEMVPMRRVYDPTGLDRLDPEEWQAIAQHFEGYAIGGRVDANRDFSYNPLTVRRGR
jgi:hypothetical protein